MTKYEYELYSVSKNYPNTNNIRFEKITRIQIRIIFGFPKMTEYEYEYYSAFQKWPNTNTNIIRLSEYKYYLASEVWQNILKYIAEKS